MPLVKKKVFERFTGSMAKTMRVEARKTLAVNLKNPALTPDEYLKCEVHQGNPGTMIAK